MKFVTYYRGSNHTCLGDDLKCRPNINGSGVFFTRDKDYAEKYGKVIAYVLPVSFEFQQVRQVGGIDTIDHTVGAVEYIIRNQKGLRDFYINLEDEFYA